MTNKDACNYSRIALLNLIENNIPINPNTILYEMNTLFDLYSEEAIEKEVFFRL